MDKTKEIPQGTPSERRSSPREDQSHEITRRNAILRGAKAALLAAAGIFGGKLGRHSYPSDEEAIAGREPLPPRPTSTPIFIKGKEATLVRRTLAEVNETFLSDYKPDERQNLEARVGKETDLIKNDTETLIKCKEYASLEGRILNRYHFSPELKNSQIPRLLPALIYVESKGIESNKSDAGALGLCQIIPDTVKDHVSELGIDRDDFLKNPESYLFDSNMNMTLALMHLDDLYGIFGREDIALLAYNLGQGNVADIINYKLKLGFTSSKEDRLKILSMAKQKIKDNNLNYENLIETDFVPEQIDKYEKTEGDEGFNAEPLRYVPGIIAADRQMAA